MFVTAVAIQIDISSNHLYVHMGACFHQQLVANCSGLCSALSVIVTIVTLEQQNPYTSETNSFR